MAYHICVNAQCGSSIATFPYVQDFEATSGGWFTGGSSSDWEWGNPKKPIINSAFSGSKCWVTGGLTNGAYNNSEASWIQSPCFDFTTLQYPFITFNIWSETERNYDGAGFQYSLDNGSSWIDAGSTNNAADCINQNWFNVSSIRYLTLMNSGNGWSGSIPDPSGAHGWITAKKPLPILAGKSNVIFRFVFGSGSINNNFDGFAMDDFGIGEAPPNKADFITTCGQNNNVDFRNVSALCPAIFSWNFGDPGAGALNTSSLVNPSHIFSTSGVFNVSLTVSNPNNASSTITKQVSVFKVSSAVTTTLKCNGDNNGSAIATVSGIPPPYSYSWNTTPVQTNAAATNLVAGTYTVTVTAANGCPTLSTVILTEPAALRHDVSFINPGCVATTGSINITETGGTPPYTYTWSPNVSTTASATGLTAGTYNITVTDKSSCTDVFSVDIVNVIPPAVSIDSKADVTCNAGNNGMATASVSGGVDTITYSWNTNPVQTALTATNLKAGSYIFTAKDGNNCISNVTVTINEPPATTVSVITKDATCGIANGSISLFPTGNTNNYQYTWTPAISNNTIASNIKPGKYIVELKDNAGCITKVPEIRISNIGVSTKIFLGKDTTICTGEKVILSTLSSGTYLWQDNSTANTFIANQTGKYWLRLTNGDGCVSSDTIAVNVVTNCIDIYFPTVFSPNNDGLNDNFGPIGNLNAVSNYKLIVYNRWGNVVFSSTDPRKRWDGMWNGELTADATYTWFASYIFEGSAPKFKKGALVIVR